MNKRLPPLLLLATVTACDQFHPHDQGAPIPESRFRQIAETSTSALPAATTTRPTTHPATQPIPAAQTSLTVADVRRMAMANNLDIQVELYNPTISKTSISEEEAKFEALFTTDVNYTRNDTATASQLESPQSESVNVTPGIALPLRTGGRITVDAPAGWSSTNNRFSTLNPVWTNDAQIGLSQPLLRGFGREVAEYSIRVARLDYQRSEARTRLEVIRILAEAERVYWRLYAARQELVVRKQEYDLAVAQLNRAKRRAGAGAGAQVDVVRADSGVADALETVITAENNARDRERELKRILHQPDLPMDSPTVIVTASEPRPTPYHLDGPRLADRAMAGRMELLELELQILQDVAAVNFARNDTLPLVSLDYRYRVNGLGASFDDSISMLADKNFEDHTVGLHVEIPIGNQAARARLRRAMLNRLQTLATKEQRQLQIRQEVLSAVDNLDVTWQRILASRQRVVAAARVVEAETRQFNIGLRTSTDVLDAQTRLANAKSSEVSALTDYQIAQIDIAFATGTLLGASHVDWTPARMPHT